MKEALLIVNPHSGKKDGEHQAQLICNKLAAHKIESTVFVSHQVSAMKQFLQDKPLAPFDFVGLVGGDGTMHEFINAAINLYGDIPVPIALFPCGTGNAFNFDIGSNTIQETLDSILTGQASFIDVAEVQCAGEKLWSFNILGCGLVADINKLAETMRWLGASRYTLASVIKLIANPRKHFIIKTDQGTMEGKFSFVLACNTRYTGKGMLMAPHAILNDSKFDVIVVKACRAYKLLRLFPKIFKGEHLGADVVLYMQTSFLEVASPGLKLPTNIDGELRGYTPFKLRVLTNKVRVFMRANIKTKEKQI